MAPPGWRTGSPPAAAAYSWGIGTSLEAYDVVSGKRSWSVNLGGRFGQPVRAGGPVYTPLAGEPVAVRNASTGAKVAPSAALISARSSATNRFSVSKGSRRIDTRVRQRRPFRYSAAVLLRSEALFLGGRSGVGKSSVGNEIHVQLSASGVRHCLIEGDNLDMAYPPPWEHGLGARNLAAMWGNYRALDYRRMIYTNTVSVRFVGELTAAMGDDPRVTAVLLTASDMTARERLAQREIGTALQRHVDRSDVAARELDRLSPSWVHRVVTDGRTVADIATEIIDLTDWTSERP
jgi:hypothetical protein